MLLLIEKLKHGFSRDFIRVTSNLIGKAKGRENVTTPATLKDVGLRNEKKSHLNMGLSVSVLVAAVTCCRDNVDHDLMWKKKSLWLTLALLTAPQ